MDRKEKRRGAQEKRGDGQNRKRGHMQNRKRRGERAGEQEWLFIKKKQRIKKKPVSKVVYGTHLLTHTRQ